MCMVEQMAPNFGCTTRCRTLGGVTLPPASDLDHLDFEPPPFSPPKLRRCDETVATTVQHSPTPQPESPFPDVPCLSKPRLSRHFRTRTPALHFLASARGDVDELTDWLRTGGDPNSRDSDGWALLLHASMHGRLECVKLLLRHGASHDTASEAGHTPLHVAAANRHCDVVRRLAEAGASIEAQNSHGNTPLHSAAATGTVDVVSYLLSRSADPDVTNTLGETADRVSGAGPEAFELLQEARQQKQARIAQWLALVNLHELWIAGRAEPKSDKPAANATSAARDDDRTAGPDEKINSATRISGASAASEGGVGGSARRRSSLESTVAGVADLPREVFRRLVTFCAL